VPCPIGEPADLLPRLLAQARRLLSVHWDLTHRCNERCRHCFLPVSPPDDAAVARRELTTGEALALIDQFAALGVLYVTFSGGEPLLRDDFFILAEHVRRRRLALRIYTNGTLLVASPAQPMGPDPADRLAALHPLAVEISLYAARPAVHDAITGVEGSWAATVAALRRLHARGVHTVCKTPLMRPNAAELPAIAALAAELGARFQPDPLLTAGVGETPAQRRAPLALRLRAADLAAVLRTLNAGHTPGAGVTGAASRGPLLCTIGRSALAIDPNGAVFPCVEVRRPLGSVRRTPLGAIWHDTAAWAPYLYLSADPPGGVAALPACRACRLGAWCIRCHGAAANETGDLYGPSPPHCRAAGVRRALAAEFQAQGDPMRK
jgi:radical SAM protein with 4Fe4S-binding SPASM domain